MAGAHPREVLRDTHGIAATQQTDIDSSEWVTRPVWRRVSSSGERWHRGCYSIPIVTDPHSIAQQMNRNASSKARPTPQSPSSIALYEVIYVDASPQRAPALPKPTGRIAYVRRMGLEGPYLVPQGGRWIAVSPEAAFQRAEGLRRLRASTRGQRSEQAAS